MEKLTRREGAPNGNTNNSTGSAIKDALRYALINYTDSRIKRGEALKAIMSDVVSEAVSGEWKAREYITDRTEGKAAQTTNVNITKSSRELTDEELNTIAGSAGTLIETNSEEESN